MQSKPSHPAPDDPSGPAAGRFAWFIAPADRLADIANVAAALCLLAIFGLVGAEVLARNLANTSISFSWDVAAYLMGSCFMLSCASALKSGSHVRVTGLAENLPPKAAHALDLFACFAGLAAAVMLAWAIGQMAWLSFERGSTSASVVRIPLVLPQSVLAFGAILLCLQLAAQFLRLVRGEGLPAGSGLE
ncbi:TRAP transporter small permease subunit [Mangrovicoccus ximenensis]|uniref:TRAP transporter small permease subunit n=1 Tax=Mangrovicoccus ximenensis TaxID=1911570 RepID=UPI000D3C7BA0|nr:TRAP transporter small permease [Mangrovicoccus ximenensis]